MLVEFLTFKTPHNLFLWVSYGVNIVTTLVIIEHVLKGLYCTIKNQTLVTLLVDPFCKEKYFAPAMVFNDFGISLVVSIWAPSHYPNQVCHMIQVTDKQYS